MKTSLRFKSIFAKLFPLLLLVLVPVGCGPSDAQLEKAIGNYIQKNPQALQKVIADAMKAQRPQRPPELPLEEKIKRAVKVPLNNAPTRGASSGPITIVEFSDFQCPFCKRVLPTVDELIKDYPG